jgi:hypothetical protein
MQTAKLSNGTILSALEYSPQKHGFEIYCLDKNCSAPLIFVDRNTRNSSDVQVAAHFKTTGKDESTRHKKGCGFYDSLDVIEAIEKVNEYQQQILEAEGTPKNVIRLSLNLLDPDHVKDERGEKEKSDNKDETDPKVKDTKQQPTVISSMKSIIKLLTDFEPDILGTVYFSVNGRKLPMSQLVLSPRRAYHLVWEGTPIPKMKYFVYGKILNATKLKNLLFLDFENIDDSSQPFSIVVFENYFKNFKYSPDEVKGRYVLVYGALRQNDYQNRRKTEIILKTDKYFQMFNRKPELE